MEQNISIPIKTLTGWNWLPSAWNYPIYFAPTYPANYFGGGTDNYSTYSYGWPDGCCVGGWCPGLGADLCEEGGDCAYGLLLGQQYPTTDPDPARKVKVTTALGVDKTHLVDGAIMLTTWTGAGELTGFWADSYCVGHTTFTGEWEPGDIIHVPGGTTKDDSWNLWNNDSGHADGSHEVNIVVQEEWMISQFDTSPLYLNISDIICVRPVSTTSVSIVTRIPSQTGTTATAYHITMAEAAPSAMSLVECVNRALKEAVNSPLSNPQVDWSFSNSLTQYAENYGITFIATP